MPCTAALQDGLVSYWPLDVVAGVKTPDLISGYDMELANLTAADLVEGRSGKAFRFDSARQTLLRRVNSPGEKLPINQHPALTIAFWANVTGTGQLDLRLFSEGNTANNNPLFNLGTASDGSNGSLDLFFRQTGWTDVNHIRSVNEPLDGTWHHIVFVQETDGSRAIYIDGVRDDLEIPAKAEGAWDLNTTTIGGILRANPTHWVSGTLDEVMLWSRALTGTEITQVFNEGLNSVIPPLTRGMVAYWPLNEVSGVKTPDLANGYDLELQNLSAADLVDGKWGKAMQFDSARQTLLRRVHSPGELLPVNQFPALTVSLWVNIVGAGQNDLRIFSEGSTSNNDPLFNLGTANNGNDGTLDLFLRRSGWTTIDHLRSVGEPLDGTWRHIAFVQQEDGSRALYLDGVLDPVEIPAKPEGDWNVNTTTVGGILRANPTHWVSGLIDDVALWNRALSEAELQTVVSSGTPTPYTPPRPLVIRAFYADLPAVAVGDSVTLNWDVTTGVQVEIDQGVGDVTAQTVSGLGSVQVPLTQTRTFTLTVTRGAESATQTLTVHAIGDVAAGWTLIDNFDRYTPGPLNGNSLWKDLTATGFSIVDLAGNRLLAPNNVNVGAVLPLRSLTQTVGQRRTLFFRAYVRGDDAEPVRAEVVLTDRRLRFGNEINNGPGARLSDEWEAGVMAGGANGFNAEVEFYEPVFDLEAAYNIWVDINNGPAPADQSGTGDTYSIHVQKASGGPRTTLIQDYFADRDPVGQADVGFTLPDLDSLAIIGRAGHSTLQNLLFDDFYLSKADYNATVPRAFGFSEPVAPPAEFSVTIQRTATGLEITWPAGTLESADAITGPFNPVAGASSPHAVATSATQQFYRVRQ